LEYLLELAILAESTVQRDKKYVDAAIFEYAQVVRPNVSSHHIQAGFFQCFGDTIAALDANVTFFADAAHEDGDLQTIIYYFQFPVVHSTLFVILSGTKCGEESGPQII